MNLQSILIEFESVLPFLYSLLFVVSIGVFKKHSSLSLIVVILALAEFIMSAVTLPLLEVMNDKSIAYVYRLSAWVGFWILASRFIIFLLQKAHIWLNVTKGRELIFAQSAYIGIIGLHTIYFINAVSVKLSFVAFICQIGNPIINLSLASYLLFAMLKQMEFSWKTES